MGSSLAFIRLERLRNSHGVRSHVFRAWMLHEPAEMCTSECMQRSTRKNTYKDGKQAMVFFSDSEAAIR
jgi:hypothetical protein